MMNTNEAIELIDLGVASIETRGMGLTLPEIIDFRDETGLTDD
jgi:hypothetical protein